MRYLPSQQPLVGLAQVSRREGWATPRIRSRAVCTLLINKMLFLAS